MYPGDMEVRGDRGKGKRGVGGGADNTKSTCFI